jgi:hypothetical protein
MEQADENREIQEISMATCDKLVRFNTQLTPGAAHAFDTFTADFCLTDVVIDLASFPDGLDSKATCTIWLTKPEVSSQTLFPLSVDKHGQRVNLTSGIVCPKGYFLSANAGLFVTGNTASIWVVLTGYTC